MVPAEKSTLTPYQKLAIGLLMCNTKKKHDIRSTSSEMTVDAWFEFWITNLIVDLAPNTKRNYRERYCMNIQPVIGSMRLCDVKPMHCKIVLNRMEATYAGSTIRQAYHHGNHVPGRSYE